MTKPRTLLEDSISMSIYIQTSGAKIEKIIQYSETIFRAEIIIFYILIFPCLFERNFVEIYFS